MKNIDKITFLPSVLFLGFVFLTPFLPVHSLESQEGFEDPLVDHSNALHETEFGELYKRSPVFDFGLGKRKDFYSFGLGKRRDLYGFGLGKRSEVGEHNLREYEDYAYDDDSMPELDLYTDDSIQPLDKRQRQFNFGLGKRFGSQYDFGLGKRGRQFDFGLGKRSSKGNKFYSFGLGKRNRVFSFGLGKRPASQALSRFNFGLGKRSENSETSGGIAKRDVREMVQSEENNFENLKKTGNGEAAGNQRGESYTDSLPAFEEHAKKEKFGGPMHGSGLVKHSSSENGFFRNKSQN